MRRAWAGLAALALGLATPGSAAAYKCATVEDSETSLYWLGRTLPYWVNTSVLQLYGTEEAELEASVKASFQVWTDIDCSDIVFNYQGSGSSYTAGFNNSGGNQNVVTVVTDWKYAPAAIAITTTTYATSGRMYDADIEINHEYFEFMNVATTPGCSSEMDLQNILTHEAGHVLGLAHSLHSEATMYGSGPVCETIKRSLDEDDIEAICQIYPAGESVQQCDGSAVSAVTEERSSGCGAAGRPIDRDLGVLLFGLGLVALLGRRRADHPA